MSPRGHTKSQRRARNEATHCAYCGHKLYASGKRKSTIDHFYPVSKHEHVNKTWNKFMVCQKCNTMKGCIEPLKFAAGMEKTALNLAPSNHRQDLLDMAKAIREIESELKYWFLMRDLI